MTDEEKRLIRNVYTEKADKKINACIILTILNITTYLYFIIMGDFDFGIICEGITLLLIFLAKSSIANDYEAGSIRYVVLSIIPIGWLIIFDFIAVITNAVDIMDFIYWLLAESILIADVVILYLTYKDLRRAFNPEKYSETKDNFYEKLDNNDNNK